MKYTISEEFKHYAYFSARVDHFFGIVSIYGRYHKDFKFLYSQLPSPEIIQAAIDNESLPGEIKNYLWLSSDIFQEMSITRIFSGTGDTDLTSISDDALNFAFYTCFCFQWSLFETFVKTMIKKLIDAHKLPDDIERKLRSAMRGRTEEFFKIIDSGNVFGHSPFETILPIIGWVPTYEQCNYQDLDSIRKQRNDFIHGVVSPEITTDNIIIKQRKYRRSMWILRKFAENILFEVNNLLDEE